MTGPDFDHGWLERAIELSYRCPPATGAYSVGAVIVDARGTEVSRGWSRETDPYVHAEESALAKLTRATADGVRLGGSTLYSSLEPCSHRSSRPRSCTELILAAGIARVVVAWREPDLFVAHPRGCELLAAGGVVVRELPALAARARAANVHLGMRTSTRVDWDTP